MASRADVGRVADSLRAVCVGEPVQVVAAALALTLGDLLVHAYVMVGLPEPVPMRPRDCKPEEAERVLLWLLGDVATAATNRLTKGGRRVN